MGADEIGQQIEVVCIEGKYFLLEWIGRCLGWWEFLWLHSRLIEQFAPRAQQSRMVWRMPLQDGKQCQSAGKLMPIATAAHTVLHWIKLVDTQPGFLRRLGKVASCGPAG